MGNKIKEHKLKLVFEGAAGTVTGSCTLVQYKNFKFYVDCGMYQGPKEYRELNRRQFPKAKSLDCVILTHAHVDHSGLLPRLVDQGFKGPIYCSQATYDLCQILLPDSAHLQKEDAQYANKTGHSKHRPAKALYNLNSVKKTLKLFKVVKDHEWFSLTKGLSFQFHRNSHILGARFVSLAYDIGNTTKIHTFTGDLGHNHSKIMLPSETFDAGGTLLLESTYGDRNRKDQDALKILEKLIKKAYKQKSCLIIPSFAVGRTQEVLSLIKILQEKKRIPLIPLFLDSPMAIDATEIYRKHPEELNKRFVRNRLESFIQCERLEFVRTAAQSELLTRRKGPMVVISAAGMLTGGRILHHLKARLPHEENCVLFVGHQVEGTKGHLLQNGLKTIRLHHQQIEVNAEIVSIETLSAHADSDEILEWLSQLRQPPKKIFLNHGERLALQCLKYRIESELEITCHIVKRGETFELGKKIVATEGLRRAQS